MKAKSARREQPPPDSPVQGRKPLTRSVPIEWLDGVLLAATELEPDATLEERAAALVDAAAGALPACAVGVLIPRGAQDPIVIRRSPRANRSDISDPARLFPEFGFEQVAPIELDHRATLHLASDDQRLLDDAAVSVFMDRLAAVLRASIRHGRAHDVLREQVIRSDKLASLGQIAAGVVHELNNPLTSILAYSDYLRRKGERSGTDPADLDRLARINEAATRILRFSRDLIAYSKPSTEKPAPISLHDVIDRALLFCEHVLDQTGVIVEKRFGDVPPVLGVTEQLTQVFVNLFTNAAQAMHEHGGCLGITTEPSDGGAYVRAAICDDGHGIEGEHLPRIFEPFFTTKTDGTGTGLGLSIVRSIVAAHGGRVRAEIRTPCGMVFYVDLPAAGNGQPSS
jgi:signal transduction histidine kinase